MGYVYCGESGRLCCDTCGEPGARKRTCPHKVTHAEGGKLPMCTAPAMCAACFEKAGGSRGLHAACKELARNAQAQEDARKARLEQDHAEHRGSWGDWHAAVPNGFVGMRFVRRSGEEVYRLGSEAVYKRVMEGKLWLEDVEAELLPWEGHDSPKTKRVAPA